MRLLLFAFLETRAPSFDGLDDGVHQGTALRLFFQVVLIITLINRLSQSSPNQITFPVLPAPTKREKAGKNQMLFFLRQGIGWFRMQ